MVNVFIKSLIWTWNANHTGARLSYVNKFAVEHGVVIIRAIRIAVICAVQMEIKKSIWMLRYLR